MGKILIFPVLWYIFGNPFIALIVFLILIYFLDRRFVGLLPNVFRPAQLARKTSRLRADLRLNPHDFSARHELARVLMERRKYREAHSLLEELHRAVPESAEVMAELAICCFHLRNFEQGGRMLAAAAEASPRVKYGEPYLAAGEALAGVDPGKAAEYLETFRSIQSSSCKGYYRLGQVYGALGRKDLAREAFQEAVNAFRVLPRYRRKPERRWYVLAKWKLMTI
jgi:tetratricopeptide (TPR) repeat protein